jgi:SAM-dependent methyltransferase
VREYDLIADWYSNERIDQTGVPEVTTLAAALAPASLVLDAGCGNGLPLSRALLGAGHRVVGLDSSAAMLLRFRANLSRTPAVRAIVEHAPFVDASFDAAIAWGVLFHLTLARQRHAIEEVSRLLRPRAPFLFTSGGDPGQGGEVVGVMNGVTFHYYSFTIDQYREILGGQRMRLVETHEDSGRNRYYLAEKLV